MGNGDLSGLVSTPWRAPSLRLTGAVAHDTRSDPLPGGDGVRYRLVGEGLDFEEAGKLVVALRSR